ncbi:MAG: hypothetical protein ABSG67_05685 [Thermoguttaceae bacterium]|jgi:hypothetical protein
MIDVELHFQGSGIQRQRLPALTHVGEYLTHAGRLWRVDAVVHSTPTATWGKGKIDVYVLAVSVLTDLKTLITTQL